MAQRAAPAMQESWVPSLGWEDPWRREWQPTPVFLLENPMDRGAWRTTFMVSQKSDTTEQLTLSLSKDLIKIGNHEFEQTNLLFPVISYV